MNLQSNDVRQWFDDHGSNLVSGGLRVLVILVVALVARTLLHRAINRLVRSAVDGRLPGALHGLRDKARALESTVLLSERRRQRTETLGSVLRSIASATVGVIALAMVLGEIGLDLTPIVASAGIVGVAVGFGAQNLIKDFLAGMFMLLEDQYGVGDVVDAGAATGIVEAVTLRTTRLRDAEGTVWYVRNGEINRVGNKSQGWSRALLDVPLALGTDVATARALALDAALALKQDEDYAGMLLEDPEVWGLEAIGADGLVLRITIKTVATMEGPVERALRERLIATFEEHDITIGVPQRLVWKVDPEH
ncbi:MAG: moderate conductance mechanosensitive channel [Frankiales bacterium]|nr:moderate conductance mechanosensitive channel [Frankiales bacterium]